MSAAVGLVQFLIWVVFALVLIGAMQAFFLPELDMEALRNAGAMAGDMPALAGAGQLNPEQLQIVQKVLQTIEPSFLLKFLGLFLFYFIGGYLLYASLFAAIGAAVDNETDSQQFLTPLSILLVVGLYIGFTAMKKPGVAVGVLEFFSAFHLAYRDAGACAFRGAGVGGDDFDGVAGGMLYLFHLAFRTDIPGGYPDVWQKDYVARAL